MTYTITCTFCEQEYVFTATTAKGSIVEIDGPEVCGSCGAVFDHNRIAMEMQDNLSIE